MTVQINQRFKRWTVLAPAPSKNHRGLSYLCLCDCGTERVVRKDQLTRGISKSCGCWKAEVASKQIRSITTTHGLSKTRTYMIWKGIRKRCLNQASKNYARYGGRGITFCKRWQKYENFLADMGDAPNGASIDRIDNNRNYEPGNCRWATARQQVNNTRRNVRLTINGESLTVGEWAYKAGLPYHTLWQRLYRLGWSLERALSA